MVTLENNKEFIIEFMGDEPEKHFIPCVFLLKTPKDMSPKHIFEVREWVDGRIKLGNSARIWIKRENPDEYPAVYRLIISGRGSDERCTWCRSFRTALREKIKGLGFEIKEIDACTFER